MSEDQFILLARIRAIRATRYHLHISGPYISFEHDPERNYKKPIKIHLMMRFLVINDYGGSNCYTICFLLDLKSKQFSFYSGKYLWIMLENFSLGTDLRTKTFQDGHVVRTISRPQEKFRKWAHSDFFFSALCYVHFE